MSSTSNGTGNTDPNKNLVFGSGGEGGKEKLKYLHMADLSGDDFVELFASLDAVMFDCDGVIWLGNHPMTNSQALIKKLRAMKKRVFFITNNSTKTRQEFLIKFNKLGYEATLEEIVSTSYLAALYLKEKHFNKKVYVIGTPGVVGELTAVGIESLPIGPDLSLNNIESWTQVDLTRIPLDDKVGAVVVGFDFHVNYVKLFKAASYLRDPECIFIATNTDESFPALEKLIVPGTGAIVSAVQTAAGRQPVIMGKPSTIPYEFIKRSYNIDSSRTLMIGDRGNTDIAFGRNCNMRTLLVLTGVTTLDEVKAWDEFGTDEQKKGIPDFYLESVGELYNLMKIYYMQMQM